jgi:hypothetical protein
MDDYLKATQLDTTEQSSSHSDSGSTSTHLDLNPTCRDLVKRFPAVATLLSDLDNEQKAGKNALVPSLYLQVLISFLSLDRFGALITSNCAETAGEQSLQSTGHTPKESSGGR